MSSTHSPLDQLLEQLGLTTAILSESTDIPIDQLQSIYYQGTIVSHELTRLAISLGLQGLKQYLTPSKGEETATLLANLGCHHASQLARIAQHGHANQAGFDNTQHIVHNHYYSQVFHITVANEPPLPFPRPKPEAFRIIPQRRPAFQQFPAGRAPMLDPSGIVRNF